MDYNSRTAALYIIYYYVCSLVTTSHTRFILDTHFIICVGTAVYTNYGRNTVNFHGRISIPQKLLFLPVRNLSTVNNFSLSSPEIDVYFRVCGLGFLLKTNHRPVRFDNLNMGPTFQKWHDLDFDVLVFHQVHELGLAN